MDDSAPLIDRADRLRREMIAFIDTLDAEVAALELPRPPDTLQRGRDKLAENEYNVLVVGEAKRGKSSFINALIGKELLPKDVDVATCQVFRVRPAVEEAYRIRFEDGSQLEIGAADLPRYGSQVIADLQGAPKLDQIIRWIEVDVPIKFLPPGVNMFDTPGFDSAHDAHTQITQRFVPYADAVIYVLDSSQPLGQPDLEFIEQLLGVTSNLFFPQTKIDLYRQEDWKKILQRNQDLLDEHFGQRLSSTRVWPISNRNLLKAAQTGDEDYLTVSRQGELSTALQAFLFRVAGWYRAALTASIADRYFGQTRETLAGRVAALTESTLDKRNDWQVQATLRLQQFEAEWGVEGTQRQTLIASVQEIALEGKHSFEEALQSGGPVEWSMIERVDALRSLQEAEQLAAALPGDMHAEVNRRWLQMCDFCTAQTARVIEPFALAAEAVTVPHWELPDDLSVGPGPLIKPSLASKIVEANKASSDTSHSGLVELLYSIDPGLATIAWLGSTIFGFVRGWRLSQAKQLSQAQEMLRTYVQAETLSVRAFFLSTGLGEGQRCLMDETLDTLTQTVTESLGTDRYQKASRGSSRGRPAVRAGTTG